MHRTYLALLHNRLTFHVLCFIALLPANLSFYFNLNHFHFLKCFDTFNLTIICQCWRGLCWVESTLRNKTKNFRFYSLAWLEMMWNWQQHDSHYFAVAWMVFVLFCCKICSVAIYAVLSRNIFCRDLRTFCVEKN